MRRYLGIDWGERRIGLALADGENMISTPFKTVNDIKSLILVIKEENINTLIIGQPKSMKDSKIVNPKYLKFLEVLKNRIEGLNLDIFFIDERLTSLEADSIMNKKMNNNRDSLAAMIILQSYLDKNKYANNKSNSHK
jgi:putative holliday junction resolvase